MASSSATAKVALDKVAWEFVQDECTAKEQVIKSLQDQLEDFEDKNDKQANSIVYLEATLADVRSQKRELWNSLDAAREEVERLKAKNKELESENDRLRDEKVTAPPAKKLCTIARR